MIESQDITLKTSIRTRLPAVDALRGLVMVLMTLDHASHAFNAGRYARDSFLWYQAGAAIPAAQFLIRWVTHLCAPTFLFLAGFVLALSVAGRQARGAPGRAIDREIFIRGVCILLLDPLWMSIGFGEGIVLQVLYAIGVSFCLMALLRRLAIRSLFAVGLGILFFGEGLAGLAVWAGDGQRPGLMGAFFITGGTVANGVFVLYPVLPWLAYMILGWVCGKYMLQRDTFNPIRFFSVAGAASLLAFFVTRGFNKYGNMLLYRYDNSILQWLHVSKYPPSLTFSALELGLMFVMLSLFFAWYRNRNALPANPLQVFGRTPLFFYVIHVHLLAAASWLLDMHQTGGLTETYVATVAALVVLYPLCRWYGYLKQAHPKSLLRYL
ncbi:MAG: heparan-alpha-glucosaminide N-acetyltransferase domain-containing protein [Desulfobacterales bacterium]|jgi:uncharacterized membrane protein